MKKAITSFILSASIILNLQASPPPPRNSSVTLKMTRTVEVVTPPTKEALAESARNHAKYGLRDGGHICYGDQAHYLFEPEFTRGLDAISPPFVLNLYIITTNTKREMALSKPISQIVPADPSIPLAKDDSYHHLIQWRCKCRRRGDTMSTVPEWYVEVIQGGKLLCSSQSSSSPKLDKLIKSRTSVTTAP